MKKSRLAFQASLFVLLVSFFIFERYAAKKIVDESRYITPKVTSSPLSRHSSKIPHSRTNPGDRVSSVINKMRAAGLPVYEDEIIPEFEGSLQNGVEDLKAALDLISQSKKGSAIYDLSSLWKSKLSKNDLRKISNLLKDESVQELIELAHKASEKDYIGFDLDYSQGPGLVLPHLSSARNLMKILSLKSFVDSEEGRSVEAVENLNIALKLNSIPSDDITVVGELVETAAMKILNKNVMDLRATGADLSETYKILERRLANANDDQLQTIDGERHFFGAWFYEKVLNSPGEFQKDELKSLFGQDFDSMPPAEIKEHYAQYLSAMFEVRELMEEPYYINSEKLKEKINSAQNSTVLKELLPAFSSIYEKYNESQSLLKKSLLALKVDEYELKHGVKPKTLDILDIPRDYLKDNLTGQLYRIVYSADGDAIITHIEDDTGGLKL